MNRLIRYEGTVAQLRSDVAATKVKGEWKKLAKGYVRFECEDGLILTFRASPGTLTVQGPPQLADRFERKLFTVAAKEREISQAYFGDIWELMCEVDAAGIAGKWQMKKPLSWRFWSADGAILTWNEASGKLTIGGSRSAALELERKWFEFQLTGGRLSAGPE